MKNLVKIGSYLFSNFSFFVNIGFSFTFFIMYIVIPIYIIEIKYNIIVFNISLFTKIIVIILTIIFKTISPIRIFDC